MGRDDEAPDAHARVQWVYQASSREDLEARYDRWARDYDADLRDDFGYLAPPLAVAKAKPLMGEDPLILDAGVGTGLVGEALKAAGFSRIVGIDMSQGMLDAAEAKDIYAELYRAVLGEPLDFSDDHFDATFCIGTLTLGHAPASSLEELVRVTRPGGPIVFTLMTSIYESQGFKETQERLEAAGRWQLVEAERKIHILPKGEPELEHDIWVYRVTR